MESKTGIAIFCLLLLLLNMTTANAAPTKKNSKPEQPQTLCMGIPLNKRGACDLKQHDKHLFLIGGTELMDVYLEARIPSDAEKKDDTKSSVWAAYAYTEKGRERDKKTTNPNDQAFYEKAKFQFDCASKKFHLTTNIIYGSGLPNDFSPARLQQNPRRCVG